MGVIKKVKVLVKGAIMAKKAKTNLNKFIKQAENYKNSSEKRHTDETIDKCINDARAYKTYCNKCMNLPALLFKNTETIQQLIGEMALGDTMVQASKSGTPIEQIIDAIDLASVISNPEDNKSFVSLEHLNSIHSQTSNNSTIGSPMSVYSPSRSSNNPANNVSPIPNGHTRGFSFSNSRFSINSAGMPLIDYTSSQNSTTNPPINPATPPPLANYSSITQSKN
ncbi:MAG: hypothetical protein K6D38_10925 [Pseudobutyrivibrio sp.]|nr:hypothetical protein [Pseudobutyrivibrio sp.]